MCYYPFFPGTELPDDDYRTLAPQAKSAGGNTNSNSSRVPIIITSKEAKATSKTVQALKKTSSVQQKTVVTEVSRRRSTAEYIPVECTRSAPPSPAPNHTIKPRSNHNQTSASALENERKSISGEYASLSATFPSHSLSSGTLEVRLKYDAKNSKMWVFVIKATLELTPRLFKQTLVQVHLTVLPNKRTRFRTQVKPIDNAMFAEEFFCKVLPETIQAQGIRFRLYTYERFKREKLLAQATVMFAMVNLDEDMCKIVSLERAFPSQDSDLGSRSNTNSDCHSQQNSVIRSGGDSISNTLLPELEIGLAYDRNQSILVLEIGKGINFGLITQSRLPDTFVQITLQNSLGEEIIVNRTVTRHAQCHPVFAERYPYNIQENLLDQITLVITIVNKKAVNKVDRELGWFSFGHNNSGNAQVEHWNAMLQAQSETITRWHSLLDK